MFEGMSKPTLVVATLIGGLALFVAGFIIAAEVRSVAATPKDAAMMADGLTCFNVNTDSQFSPLGDGVCASQDAACVGGFAGFCGVERTSDAVVNCSVTQTMGWSCWRCCAVTATAVGGIGQLPNVAGTGDPLPRNQIIIAAVTALVAFGAGGWYARRRWARTR